MILRHAASYSIYPPIVVPRCVRQPLTMGRQPRRPRKLWALALAGHRSRRYQHSVLACGDYAGVGGEVSEWGPVG